MKNIFLSLLMLSFLLTSCSKDDDVPLCDTTDVAATLEGIWDETPLNGIGDKVTFNSDLTGSCTKESLFVTEFNGNESTTFTWSLNMDNSEIKLKYPNGLTSEYNVVAVACDKITLELFGFVVVLNK